MTEAEFDALQEDIEALREETMEALAEDDAFLAEIEELAESDRDILDDLHE